MPCLYTYKQKDKAHKGRRRKEMEGSGTKKLSLSVKLFLENVFLKLH